MTANDYFMINRPSDTLVFHCVDHRFQEAFRKYIFKELSIDVYNPVVIAGGAYAICNDGDKNYEYIWDQIDFFIEKGGIKRLILINHEDCKWYGKENPNLESSDLKEKGKFDLLRAANKVKVKYPGVEVISVWAELSGESIRFHKID